MTPSDDIDSALPPDQLLTRVLHSDHFHEQGQVIRWFIDPELIDRMKCYSAQVWLPVFESRLPKLTQHDHLNTLFHLSGRLLKELGADFIRHHWGRWSEETFRGLAFGAVKCLPVGEAYGLVTDRLSQMDLEQRRICKFVLGWFEHRCVLKWIEVNVASPVDASWGALAARSQWDWDHTEKWLMSGRPVSLVALDALGFCLSTPIAPDGYQYKPLMDPPPDDILHDTLERYRRRDPAPRVRRTVDFLISYSKRAGNGKG